MINNYPNNSGFHSEPDIDNFVHAKIDPMLVLPPNEGVTGGLPNNHGGAVGEIPGELNISSFGAFNYKIPIELPEGIGNLTPDLGFVYNSQAGDGIMGDGWSLSGLSKISRVPYSYYYNTFTSSVIIDNDDQLMLDGNYMMKQSGTDQYKLEVEDFSKIVLVNQSDISDGFIVYKTNGLKYYYGTNEQSRYYLQTCTSPIAWYVTKIVDPNNNYIEFYYINNKTEGSFYPDYILYTGNSDAGTEPFYKVSFKYKEGGRTDSPKKYFTDNNNNMLYSRVTQYLSKVIITYIPYEKDIKEYQVLYGSEGFIPKQYVTSVHLYFDSDGTRARNSYNNTIFGWFHSDYEVESKRKELDLSYGGNEYNEFYQQSVLACNFVNRQIDNMPLSDLLHISKTGYDNKYHLRVFLNESRYGASNFGLILGDSYGSTPYTYSGFEEATETFLISTGDVDGNGFDEIIRIYKQGALNKIGIGNFDYDNPNNGYNEETKIIDYNYSETVTPKFLIGDFSGNGFDDLCVIYYNSAHEAYCHFYLSDQDAPFNNRITTGGNNFQFPQKVLLGDFNGNMKKEIVVIGSDETKLLSLRADNAAINVFGLEGINIDYDYDDDYVAGDFNNDGKTDILVLTLDNEDNWTFYFSYGKGKFVSEDPMTIESIGSGGESRICTDLNGDGYSDLCWINYTDSNEDPNISIRDYYRVDFLINPEYNDVNIKRVDYGKIETINRASQKQQFNLCVGNFTGNSLGQILSSKVNLIEESPGSHDFIANVNLTAPINDSYINCVNNITTGLGVQTKIHYCPFSAIPFSSKKIGGSSNRSITDYDFPINDYKGILNVVTSYEQEVEESFPAVGENPQLFRSVNYSYSGAKYHRVGKGFLGFDHVQETNELDKTITNRYFSIDNDFYNIENYLNEKLQFDGKMISIQEYEYTYNVYDNIRYFCKLSSKIEKKYDASGVASGLKNIVKTTYEDYDSYGNSENITKHFTTNAADLISNDWPITEAHQTDYLNINNFDIYIAGLPDYITKDYYSEEDPYGHRYHKIDNVFNPTTGQLESITYEPDDPKAYTISYIYDEGLGTFGNITQMKYSANTGIESRVWSYKYYADGRFMEEMTNPLGHIESFDYYEDIGKVNTSTDANGFVTSFEYDIFGKIKKVTYPDGTFSFNVNRWCVNNTSTEHEDAPEIAIYYNWSQNAGNPEVLTFYDQFNRVVRTVKKGFDGTKIYQDSKYYGDIEIKTGLKSHESIPYFKPSDVTYEPPYTAFDYNKLRQLSSITNPDGSSKSIVYNNNIKTVVDFDGQLKIYTYNGAGWLTKVLDNSETFVKNVYQSDGLLSFSEINNDMTTRVQYQYDAFGNIYIHNTQNSGMTTYTHNAFGDLVKEVDQVSTISYIVDKLGRTIEANAVVEDDPDKGYTSVWRYDTKTNGIGKLSYSAKEPNSGYVQGIVYDYIYDNQGRVMTVKQKLNADDLAFNYVYDVYGRLKQTFWPSGLITTNNYNEYGKMVTILDNYSNELWRAKSMNAREQYTESELGASIDLSTTFDLNNGNITDIIASKISNSQNIQSYNYLWDTRGNLEHRMDNVNNITETFDYDEYNRLTNTYVDNVLQLNHNYEAIGNIHEKTGVGIYTYDSEKPHAVTKLDGIPESINQYYQGIEYTTFDKVFHISEKETAGSEEDIISLDLGYGPNHERIWQKFADNTNEESLEKRFFNYVYEEQTNEKGDKKQLHYLNSPTGIFAIFTITNDEELTMNYLLKDHLGSINYILDATGKVEQQLNYDAWGRRRDPDTWQYYSSSTTPPTPMFDRGFTMHEHLSAFKLINMNGRMYDPVMSRFLSPDPIIQFPENSQSYNSYSYVLNNPLRFTDPSGFLAEGDSTANGKNTNWSEATAKALNIVGSSDDKEEESISSFNTDYTQTGKTESITEENSVSDKTKVDEGGRRVGKSQGGAAWDLNGDGRMTLNESYNWWKNGGGTTVQVPLSSLDLSSIMPSSFKDGVGGVETFNLLFRGNATDGLVHGTISLRLYPNNTVKAFDGPYDFDYKPWLTNPIRNIENFFGKTYHGAGTPYEIDFTGSGTISPNPSITDWYMRTGGIR